MESVGWVATGVAAIGGAAAVAAYLFEQVSNISEKAIGAVQSLRKLRDEIRKPPPSDD